MDVHNQWLSAVWEWCVCRSMGMDNMIKFADQINIPVDEVQTMGWGKELVNATVDFANKLVELNLDLTEFCILNAIVLTYPGKFSHVISG